MSEQNERHPMTTKRVLYEIAGMDDARVRCDLEYEPSSGGSLTMDVYYPRAEAAAPRPAIVLVSGYPDEGFQRILGCRFKDMASSVSWAQLFALSGIVAIAYTNREPVRDLDSLLEFVVNNAGRLGVDERRVGLFATSGHGPLALSRLATNASMPLRSLILCYSYTMNLEDHAAVADAARQWRFANPLAGRSVDDLRRDVPMFIARAGADEMPGLNPALDRFIANALTRNQPLTVVNEPTAPHAFDLVHDTRATREIVGRILTFARSTLSVAEA
jgi:hypothetical protein